MIFGRFEKLVSILTDFKMYLTRWAFASCFRMYDVPTKKHDAILATYDVTSQCCGPQTNQLWTYYLLPHINCHSFNILRVKEGGLESPPPPSDSRIEKKNRSE